MAATYTYDAWGNILSETGTVNQPYRFTTRPYNPSSGFIDLRARGYNPNIGRFIQRDPLGLEPDVNMYRYVKNNPVNYTDPTGLGNCDEWEENRECPEGDPFLEALCLACCIEKFSEKIPFGSSPRTWPGWFAWAYSCMTACLATGGIGSPDLPGPGGEAP